MINIEGFKHEEVLAGLYNNAKVQGLGVLQARDGNMSIEEAKKLLDNRDKIMSKQRARYFDYLHGRVMKITIEGAEIDERLYDRDNGAGSVQAVIDNICKGK